MISRKILALWYIRTIFVSVIILTAALCLLPAHTTLIFAVFCLCEALVIPLLYLEFRSLRIDLSPAALTISRGAIVKREIKINLVHIKSTESFITPLSKKLGLANLIIYLEGARLVTFPLNPADLSGLIEKITSVEASDFE